jgi:predicted nucleic acid-binding protein
MSDVVLDANVLPDFLSQFFGPAERGTLRFSAEGRFCEQTARRVNRIRLDHDGDRGRGIVVASVIAFVELSRKWTNIVAGRFEPYQVAALLAQPPSWFSVAPCDEELLDFLLDVPAVVEVADGRSEPIELYDALHVATAFSRGDHVWLATTDSRLRRIPRLQGRLLGRS